MQTFTPHTPLSRYRNDAFDREAMCEALKEDDPRFSPVFDLVRASRELIDGRLTALAAGEDVLRRARALERARKIRTVAAYDVVRKQLDIAAADVVRVLMPSAPNVLSKAGVKTARRLIEQAVARLSEPAAPESIRTAHLPALTAELEKLVRADEQEDQHAHALVALRAALTLFKAERQVDRVNQYAEILKLVGPALADEFFLPARTESGGDDDDGDDKPKPPATS